MYRRTIATLAIAVGLTASSAAVGLTTDQAVIEAALTHFAARKDAWFYDNSAPLAIWPRIEKSRWTADSYQYFNQGEGNCAVEQSLFEALRKRNQVGGPSSELLAKSDAWRLVRAEEEKTISPAFPPPPGVHRAPIKTLARLSRPGYSVDGSRALVFFSFNWSIHGADAQYVLTRANGTWVVACSHLSFMV